MNHSSIIRSVTNSFYPYICNKVYILIFCLTMAVTVTAQTTMREVFSQMPDSVMPYLSNSNRLDFIDFLDSNMKAEVTNLFDGKSEMTILTDDSLSIKMNSVTRVDMFFVQANTSDNDSLRQVICMVTNLMLSGQQEETSVSFFETDWTPLDISQIIFFDARKRTFVYNLLKQNSLKFYNLILNKD